MNYISTRGRAPALAFDDVLLTGLARDGGLYVPETWPSFDASDLKSFQGLSYADLAVRVMSPFVGGTLSEGELNDLVADAYSRFDHPDVAPLVDLSSYGGDGMYLMELFHGPTIAFKDYALQILGRLFDNVLAKRGEKITIVGATSGDTGSAAIEACRDRDSIEIFILHPKGRVSDVQRKQMTTVDSPNVHNIAVDGTFDDCQDMVKALFNDTDFRDAHKLSAVNSINWARIMAQVVYYVAAAVKLGAPDTPVSFAVPTGNFGNVFAGYTAKNIGLNISQFVVGSNANDILTRFFDTGAMEARGVVPTLSPSMDIQVSSNFERLMFDALGRDGERVSQAMEAFRNTGNMTMEQDAWNWIREQFDGCRLDDEGTKAVIRDVHEKSGYLLDPHSAVGVAAAKAKRRDTSHPMVALATAHPAKFPDAVEAACGLRPDLPEHLSDLFEREEKCDSLPNSLDAVRDFVAATVKSRR